jgi:hypothetical protein
MDCCIRRCGKCFTTAFWTDFCYAALRGHGFTMRITEAMVASSLRLIRKSGISRRKKVSRKTAKLNSFSTNAFCHVYQGTCSVPSPRKKQ